MAACLGGQVLFAREPSEGASVVVVYNSRDEASRNLAFYYAERRTVPTNQVFGFDLPTDESFSRAVFRAQLQEPLLRALDRERLLVLRTDVRRPRGRDKTGTAKGRVESARIRYVVLCYGVPARIKEDPSLSESGVDALAESLRRNEASVDTELAWLPQFYDKPLLTGPAPNPGRTQTNMTALGPQAGILMVARLDGPSVAVARGLVDKALRAEREGLWGRAYVDLRGLTNAGYAMGEQWLGSTAHFLRQAGYATTVDTNAATFSAAFPMSDIAFYAGWYDGEVSGPFTWRVGQFMPGAFAYHLHSFSAATLRTSTKRWVGPLLARGATATVGHVAEPYLTGALDVGAFTVRWVQGGFSYGEAVYAVMPWLSWQTTVIGDPLYRPFRRHPPSAPLGARFQELHLQLSSQTNALLEWSHLQVVNLAMKAAAGVPRSELLRYVEGTAEGIKSSVLAERQAELLVQSGQVKPAIEAYRQSLEWGGSEGQRLRVMMKLGQLLEAYTADEEALTVNKELLETYPDYPGRAEVLRKCIEIAKRLGQTEEAQRLQGMSR
jgi:uncharacterized protein (TIGR03790 family)